MGLNDEYIEEIETYKENLIGDLTVNDALILVAVCAVKGKVPENNHLNDPKRIAVLAQNHPVFSDLPDSIEPSINKFMNMIDTMDVVKAVETSASVLKPEQKKPLLIGLLKLSCQTAY
jgi:hypothetical protein